MLYLVQPLVNHAANAPGFDANRNKIYTISSGKSGLAMTQNSDGNIVQKTWAESDYQKWKIIPLSGGNFKIECVANGKVLDVPGASADNSIQLIAWDFKQSDNTNQQWRLVEQGQGTYRIEAVHSGKVMDVRDGSIAEGAAIQQHQSNNTDAQKWILSEVLPKSVLFDKKATIYQHANYGGASQELGLGSYDIDQLTIGNDQVSSVKVPEGLRVTLYEHANFRGNHKTFTSDTSYVGDDFNDKTSGILVEKVATFFEHGSYQGNRLALGVGRYNLKDIEAIGNDRLSSVKVPNGLQVTLYEHADFQGNYLVLDQDVDYLGNYRFNDVASSIVIKATGIIIPSDVLTFGSTISLKSHHGRWMSATSGGDLVQQSQNASDEKFTIIRAGDTKHNSLVSYGDIVALKSAHGKYVTAIYETGEMLARYDHLQGGEKFIVTRAGQSESNIFVSQSDAIALKTLDHNKSVTAMDNGSVVNRYDHVQAWETWAIDTSQVPPEIASAVESGGGGGCGAAVSQWSAAGVGVCGAAACLADACGAAACGAAAVLFSACGVAATALAVCGVAAVAGAVAGATVCGAAVGGLTACGADACGAAACGAAACGGAACGAAACGADACGAAASAVGGNLVGACAAEAGGIDACTADACAANVCGINLCPADACAADACAIDIIPIIPGI